MWFRKFYVITTLATLASLFTAMSGSSAVAQSSRSSVFSEQQYHVYLPSVRQIRPLPNRIEVERFAQGVAKILTLNNDGTVALKSESSVTFAFNDQQRAMVERLVTDINANRIGIAVIKDGKVLSQYGNSKAALAATGAHTANAVWSDWNGVHIYLDEWWTAKLVELNGWAIGAVIGLVVGALCDTGIGCVVAVLATDFVWNFLIWDVLEQYAPTSATLFFPWWGYANVQIWKPGSSYDGWVYQSWWWT